MFQCCKRILSSVQIIGFIYNFYCYENITLVLVKSLTGALYCGFSGIPAHK